MACNLPAVSEITGLHSALLQDFFQKKAVFSDGSGMPDFCPRPGYRYGLVQPLPSRKTFIAQGGNRLPRPDKMGNLIYLVYV